MEKLPANAGWFWVKEGFTLFRKQPIGLCTLFFAYVFLMLAISLIPIIGQILPLILIPVFSMTFMQACIDVEQDKRVSVDLLWDSFRSPAFGKLFKLGWLYLVAALVAFAASSVVDNGALWKAMTGETGFEPGAMHDTNMSLAMLVAGAVYTPAAMAFWYAAPLISWQNMRIGKAIFYSFFTVRRMGKAFFVYGLVWGGIGVLLPTVISLLIVLLFNQPALIMLVLLPLSLVLTVVMYCSFYPNYTQIFGKAGILESEK